MGISPDEDSEEVLRLQCVMMSHGRVNQMVLLFSSAVSEIANSNNEILKDY